MKYVATTGSPTFTPSSVRGSGTASVSVPFGGSTSVTERSFLSMAVTAPVTVTAARSLATSLGAAGRAFVIVGPNNTISHNAVAVPMTRITIVAVIAPTSLIMGAV